jgi:hypothetical protein
MLAYSCTTPTMKTLKQKNWIGKCKGSNFAS